MASLPSIARRLVFYSYPHDLTRDTTLLLSFMSANPQELYKDHYPLAWKAMEAMVVGTAASAVYSARLAFGVRQSNHRNITIPQTHIEIGLGQSTELSTNAEGFVHWSLPAGKEVGSDQSQGKGLLKAVNNTQEQKDICVGTLEDKSTFSPMISWPRVK
ncbi:unnamed protein product [Rhizoctonia solani]|uniref:Uncharacterized protein n=1 Tax=Rhizoctonia solani TaxID=456999 RepID=A0A8H3BB03_9AGAM|nr:unnamed protein product [Rhizoctonia solani]